MPGPSGHRERREREASGDVEGQRQFNRHAELGNQSGEGLPQVGDGFFRSLAFSVGSHTRTKLGVGTPNAVFVLFDCVGDVNDAAHGIHTTPAARGK